MEDALRTAALWVAAAVEAAATLIVAFAAAEAAARAARAALHAEHARHDRAKEAVRLRFARWLAVALEFLLAADVLRTAVAPTWEDIGKLAAVAAIRTLLNLFLRREIEAAERRGVADPPSAAAAAGAEGRPG